MRRTAFLLAIAVFISVSLSSYIHTEKSEPILLKSGPILPAAVTAYSERLEEPGYYIMQLDHIPTEEEKVFLAVIGIKLLSYVPEKAWFVYAERRPLNVKYFGKVLPGYKVSPDIKADGIINITVILFSDDDEAKNVIRNKGRVLSEFGNSLKLETDANNIQHLASIEEVKWIEAASFVPVAFNDGARALSSVEALNGTSYNLLGSNITVAIWDGGYPNHTDYNNRGTIGDPGEGSYADHATHVTGTVLGNGNKSSSQAGTPNQWRGMAPNATFVSYEWWDDVAELVDEYNASIKMYNASISQNSWGQGFISTPTASQCVALLGNYFTESQYLDNITRGALGKRVSIIWAAGNQRATSPSTYCGSLGFTYNTTTPYGTSKNTITVGAVDKSRSIASFTSWGPTDDGRVKPDVVAVGVSVVSTILGNVYDTSSGTSMSAPVVSGIAALIYEDYRRLFNADPLPSTVKALFIHTAVDLNNTGPDYHTGYGLVNATEAIRVLRQDNSTNVIIQDNVTQGTNNTYYIRISGQSGLRITLAWDDYPGDPSAAKSLVNDLDLLVYNSTGSRFYPWTLNNANPAASAVQTQRDNTNNVEQVNITIPSSGIWSITVNGTSVPNGPQNYSVISSIPFDIMPPNVTFVSPTPGNNTNVSATWVYVNITSDEEISNATLEWNNGTAANYSMSGSGTAFFYNITGLDNRTYSYRVFASDTLNNSGVTQQRFVTVDTVFPNVTIYLPLNQTYNATPSLNFTTVDLFGSIDRCWYTNSTGNSITLNACMNLSVITNVSEGFNNVTLYVNDSAGNMNSTRINFTLDFPPSLSINSPLNKTYNTVNIPLNYSVSDAFGVDKCWLVNATGGLQNLTNCNNLTINATANRLNNITLTANDTNGNVNSTQIFFSVDTILPEIIFRHPTPNNTVVNDANTVLINATISEPVTALLEFNGENLTMANVSSGTYVRNVSISSVGNYTFRVWANDTGNNTNVSETRWVKINDTINPALNVTSPASTTYPSASIPLNFIATDNMGVNACWYKLNSASNVTITNCANLTITASEGSNTLVVVVNDTANNRNETFVAFTYTPPIFQGPPAAGTGSGTVALVTTTTMPLKRTEPTTSVSIPNIAPDSKAEISSLELRDVNLRKIEIDAKNGVANARIEATKIEEKPSGISSPSDKVYHYIEIEEINITDDDIRSVKLGFQVEKSWILSEKIEENTVKLNRFSEGTWNVLNTNKTGQDALYIFYEARSPGLSIFAITAKQKAPQEKPPEIPVTTTMPPEVGHQDEKPESPTIAAVLVIIFLSVIFLSIYFYFFQNKKNKKLNGKMLGL